VGLLHNDGLRQANGRAERQVDSIARAHERRLFIAYIPLPKAGPPIIVQIGRIVIRHFGSLRENLKVPQRSALNLMPAERCRDSIIDRARQSSRVRP
jgi:hypothetical protein